MSASTPGDNNNVETQESVVEGCFLENGVFRGSKEDKHRRCGAERRRIKFCGKSGREAEIWSGPNFGGHHITGAPDTRRPIIITNIGDGGKAERNWCGTTTAAPSGKFNNISSVSIRRGRRKLQLAHQLVDQRVSQTRKCAYR
ncbi:MAG: hypothetical protein EZS28_027709 [Streblomastix strix]|uniref:Uncharacterized protein n=1 Tax=Streblomastix strix TaxID=222440 RepID=A0A5J4V2T7_9EUKA|nr:MAG: hypothetical protein EZS28_027709 [Streblomastix strix]